MDLSVVVLTWNSEKHIEKCLQSVIKDASSDNMRFEIIVVDNGSTDLTKKFIKDIGKDAGCIQLIELPTNMGTTVSRNMALKLSQGEYILLLDSDTELRTGAIKELINTIQIIPDVGIVCPRLFYPDNSIQKSFQKFPTLLVKLAKFWGLEKKYVKIDQYDMYEENCYKHDWDRIMEVDWSFSATWLIPKRVLTKVGLFDEKIFYSPEDVDFCIRIWKSGFRIVHNPNALVTHNHQRISHKYMKFTISHTKGLFYVFHKHRYCLFRNSLYRQFKLKKVI